MNSLYKKTAVVFEGEGIKKRLPKAAVEYANHERV